jgi:hypothetical protein
MLHPADPIRGRLLNGLEQQLMNIIRSHERPHLRAAAFAVQQDRYNDYNWFMRRGYQAGVCQKRPTPGQHKFHRSKV